MNVQLPQLGRVRSINNVGQVFRWVLVMYTLVDWLLRVGINQIAYIGETIVLRPAQWAGWTGNRPHLPPPPCLVSFPIDSTCNCAHVNRPFFLPKGHLRSTMTGETVLNFKNKRGGGLEWNGESDNWGLALVLTAFHGVAVPTTSDVDRQPRLGGGMPNTDRRHSKPYRRRRWPSRLPRGSDKCHDRPFLF